MSGSDMLPDPASDAGPRPTMRELMGVSFKVGCLSFGGPAGQIALMHRVFVTEKRWVDEKRYLHALNFCMLLPGPEAQQLATYVGWLLHGVRGGIVAGALFVLPGALVVFALAWIYAALGATGPVGAFFFGIKAAVLALVAEALVRIGGRALKTRADLIIAVLAFVALALFQAPFPLVIAAAAAIGALNRRPIEAAAPELPAEAARASVRRSLSTALVWGLVWMAPLLAALVILGLDNVLTRVGLLFSKLAVVTFGGAYTVLAYLQQQAVDAEAWLTAGQMIDGLGLAETTPGPLILVNQFVGFLAGWGVNGAGLWFATACAAMASWCTFAPSFLWIFAGAPFAESLRRNARAASALAGVTAAALGVIASLAIWFSISVLFRDTETLALGRSLAIEVPVFTTVDPIAALIAAAAGVALIRFHINVVVVVAACALAGLATTFFG